MRLSAIIILVILLVGCTGVSKNNQEIITNTTNSSEIVDNQTENQMPPLSPVVEPDPPIQLWCNDSDGMNSSTKGVVTVNDRNYDDYCLDTVKVKEYYCEGNLATSEIIDCGFGYSCNYGKCEKTDRICSDSDNGINITKQGIVSVNSLSFSGEFIDKCIDIYLVKEYWCEDDSMKTEDIKCDDGTKCVNGMCREDACFDTDDGSIYKKGVTTKGEDSKVDSCENNKEGTEYYCNGNQIVNSSFTCPNKCINGACG
ncbi:MAG: hypothetical protein ABID61_01120 [Candidatus Micrarchaeota archaeon]